MSNPFNTTDGPSCGPNGCTPVKPEVVEILTEAKRMLQGGLWRQTAYDDGQKVCAIGAVRRAARGHGNGEKDAIVALNEALPECWWEKRHDATRLTRAELRASHMLSAGYLIPSYNDASGRTVEDIISLFDHAIAGKQMPSPPKEPND